RAFVIASGHLHLVENEIGEWIAEASGARASREPQYLAPAVANEKAYAALLEAMDEEVNATLLRPSDAGRAAAALRAALARYVDAVRADPDAIAPEERVLVIAAEALERGTTSWELHASYGAALHARGETSEAVRHYEDALASGGPGAVRLNLARVLIASGDHERAGAELDRLLQADVTGEVAGHARRLRFGLREPALERDLERAGQAALAGDAKALDDAKVVFERAPAVDPDLWEAHV